MKLRMSRVASSIDLSNRTLGSLYSYSKPHVTHEALVGFIGSNRGTAEPGFFVSTDDRSIAPGTLTMICEARCNLIQSVDRNRYCLFSGQHFGHGNSAPVNGHV